MYELLKAFFARVSVLRIEKQKSILTKPQIIAIKNDLNRISYCIVFIKETENLTGEMPSNNDIKNPIIEDIRHGTIAFKETFLEYTNSITNIEAASGVPNNAENTELIPVKVKIYNWSSLTLNVLPVLYPRLPPNCNAAPSLPAEPPKR